MTKSEYEWIFDFIRRDTPSHLQLDFRALTLSIDVAKNLTTAGFTEGDDNFTREDYDNITDPIKIKRFKERYDEIIIEWGLDKSE